MKILKILIITPGKLPVPATCGGAVENLIQQLLDDNEKNTNFEFTVFSLYEEKAFEYSKKYKYTKFIFIDGDTKKYKISRVIRYLINRLPGIYIGNSYIHLVKKEINKMSKKFDYILVENSPEYGLIVNSNNMILHMHNDFLNIDTDMNKKILNKYIKVFSLSKYISGRIEEIDNSYKNIFTLYNGVNVELFEKADDGDLKIKYGIEENDFVYLYTGRIVPEKGVLELVEAFNKCKLNNAKLVIVGNLSSKKAYNKKLLKAKNGNNNIIFTGAVSYDKIPMYYKLANAGIVPSTWEEPFALTVIEHLASGHPVIITNSGAMPELVNEKVAIIVQKDSNLINNLSNALVTIKEKSNFSSKSLINQASKFNSEIYCSTFKKYMLGDFKNED